ncbi:hypothetical protein DVH05_004853 [Phytophthora capsici]|nr:hypothetical protein DVH05_004853 [Phytophthora capsici]
MKKPDRRDKTIEGDAPKPRDINTAGVRLLFPVVAFRLLSMSHSALIKWKKARAEYEESVKARSKGDDELYERLMDLSRVPSTKDFVPAAGAELRRATDDRFMSEVKAFVECVINAVREACTSERSADCTACSESLK